MSIVKITNITYLQPAYDYLGLGPIPPGTTPDQGVATLKKKLEEMLTESWEKSKYPALPDNQKDAGIMGPWSANVGGTAPSCVTQQITQDFKDWELPVDPAPINDMACQITEKIAVSGGEKGAFIGVKGEGPSERLYWGVAYVAAIIVDNPSEQGIIYAFAGAFDVTA